MRSRQNLIRIDINLELLPYQNSTTPKCPSVSEIPLSPNPIFLANRGFSPTNKESRALFEKKKLLKEAEVVAARGKNVVVFLQLKFEINDLLSNKTTELQNSDGILVSGDDRVSAMVLDYYSNLFTSIELDDIEEVVQ
nr:hypothetical protein CFP56_07212 [Quercus suber]